MALAPRSRTKPVLAIVGRPNVGKSTLFNRLTKTRDALVADVAGVTRDVIFGTGRIGDKDFLVADTGGIDSQATEFLGARVSTDALAMVSECDALVFVVDGQAGLNSEDEHIAEQIRRTGKPVYLAVNKCDSGDADLARAEFHALGVGQPFAISAQSGRGVGELLGVVTRTWPTVEPLATAEDENRTRVAVVGRPNVGKSTLVNRMLGEERMVTADLPGTTHDSVATDFERRGRCYTLIDTAGIRRRGRVHDVVEKFSTVKALQAIDLAAVVVVVIDAHETVTEQDANLLGLVVDSGRSIVIAVNKWDGIDFDQRDRVKRDLDRKLRFVDYAEHVFISALHGTGVGHLFTRIDSAWRSAQFGARTGAVTDLLQAAVEAHPPPLVRGRRIKLRYAHIGGRNPPTIVIHGNQTDALPESYKRYLANYFRDAFELVGTPVRMEFRSGVNPFEGKRNVLSPRQVQRKKRLMKHVKRKR